MLTECFSMSCQGEEREGVKEGKKEVGKWRWKELTRRGSERGRK